MRKLIKKWNYVYIVKVSKSDYKIYVNYAEYAKTLQENETLQIIYPQQYI